MRLPLAAAVFAALASMGGLAQDAPKPLHIRNARIYTVVGSVLESGELLVEGGRIRAMGRKVAAPAGATLLDAKGWVVIPGLVDPASALFLAPGAGQGSAADHDIQDDLDLFDGEAGREAVSCGITTAYVGPVGRGPVLGLGAVVRPGRQRGVVARPSAALKLAIGVTGSDTSSPAQRSQEAKNLRKLFEGAKTYREAWDKYKADLAEFEKKGAPAPAPPPAPGKRGGPKEPELQDPPPATPSPSATPTPAPKKPTKPRRDPAQEVLLKALDEKLPLTVRIEVHQEDAIRAALKLAADFKLKVVLEQATEGWKLADEIAKAKIPVIAGPVLRWKGPGSVEYLEHRADNAARLWEAGVDVSIGSFPSPGAGYDGWGASRFLLESAGVAVAQGMSREAALKAVTITAAKHLGVNTELGGLAPGRVADFVVLSGEPFEAGTTVVKTFIGGVEAASPPAPPESPAAVLSEGTSRVEVRAEKPILLKGARVVPVARADLKTGSVLVAGERIAAVAADVSAPEGATVVDLPAGSWIVPGFIDAHSHLGSRLEIDETSDSVTPHLLAVDGFTSGHPDVAEATRGGVTLTGLAPGDANLVGGRMSIVRLNGLRLDKMILREAAGLKLSLGEEALRQDFEPRSPAGAVALLRRLVGRSDGEVAVSLAQKRQTAFVNARRTGEISRLADLKRSLGLPLALLHGDEAGRLVEVVRAADLAVAFGPVHPSLPRERLETPGRLSMAGVPVAFVSDAPSAPPAQIRWMAMAAHRYGMPHPDALRALTLTPAKMLGVEADFGSIEAGKQADLVVFSGDPLAPSSRVLLVMVEGRIVFESPKK